MSFRGSPNRERISRISEKLNQLEESNEEQRRNIKPDYLDYRCKQLEDKIKDHIDSSNKKMTFLKDQIQRVQKQLDEEISLREQVLDTKYQAIANLEAKFAAMIEEEIQDRRESEIKISRLLEDKFAALKSEVTRESRIRAENISLINSTLEADLPKLDEAIKGIAIEREDTDRAIMQKCAEEISNLNEMAEEERRARENSEAATYEMLKDVTAKIRNEIDIEKREREENEENLIALLEETCKKLNAASQVS